MLQESWDYRRKETTFSNEKGDTDHIKHNFVMNT